MPNYNLSPLCLCLTGRAMVPALCSSALTPLNDFNIHQYLKYLELLIANISLVAWHGTLIPPALQCSTPFLSSLTLPTDLLPIPPTLPYPILPCPMLSTLPITLPSPISPPHLSPPIPSPISSPLPCLTNPFPNALIYFSIPGD